MCPMCNNCMCVCPCVCVCVCVCVCTQCIICAARTIESAGLLVCSSSSHLAHYSENFASLSTLATLSQLLELRVHLVHLGIFPSLIHYSVYSVYSLASSWSIVAVCPLARVSWSHTFIVFRSPLFVPRPELISCPVCITLFSLCFNGQDRVLKREVRCKVVPSLLLCNLFPSCLSFCSRKTVTTGHRSKLQLPLSLSLYLLPCMLLHPFFVASLLFLLFFFPLRSKCLMSKSHRLVLVSVTFWLVVTLLPLSVTLFLLFLLSLFPSSYPFFSFSPSFQQTKAVSSALVITNHTKVLSL